MHTEPEFGATPIQFARARSTLISAGAANTSKRRRDVFTQAPAEEDSDVLIGFRRLGQDFSGTILDGDHLVQALIPETGEVVSIDGILGGVRLGCRPVGAI